MPRQVHLVRSSAGLMHGSRIETWAALWRVQSATEFRSGWSLTSVPSQQVPGSSTPAREITDALPAAEMPEQLRALLGAASVSGLMHDLDTAVQDARRSRRRPVVGAEAKAG
jgi:hypothetical protein